MAYPKLGTIGHTILRSRFGLHPRTTSFVETDLNNTKVHDLIDAAPKLGLELPTEAEKREYQALKGAGLSGYVANRVLNDWATKNHMGGAGMSELPDAAFVNKATALANMKQVFMEKQPGDVDPAEELETVTALSASDETVSDSGITILDTDAFQEADDHWDKSELLRNARVLLPDDHGTVKTQYGLTDVAGEVHELLETLSQLPQNVTMTVYGAPGVSVTIKKSTL